VLDIVCFLLFGAWVLFFMKAGIQMFRRKRQNSPPEASTSQSLLRAAGVSTGWFSW
jgi:hypothetical protein